MQAVLSTATFARQAKAAGMSDAELLELEAVLSANPLAGKLIVGTVVLANSALPARARAKAVAIGRSTIMPVTTCRFSCWPC